MNRTKRILLSALASVALVVFLAATVYALGWIFYKVEDNYFKTGDVEVSIHLDRTSNDPYVNLFSQNGGITVEPGATISGDFTVRNDSNDPEGIWYRVYFQFPKDAAGKVDDRLADVLVATLKVKNENGSSTLVKSGPMKRWANRLYMDAQALGPGGSCSYTLELHHPEEAGNDTQNLSMTFDLAVVAVQRKNNPNASGLGE